METHSFDYFLRQSAVLGLAFVFLAAVLGIILWVAIIIVRLVNRYAAEWFESSIESHKQVSTGIRRVTKFVRVMYQNNRTTNDALFHAVNALDVFLSSQTAGLGIPAKALDQIRYARHILKKRDEYESRIREEDERQWQEDERQRQEDSRETGEGHKPDKLNPSDSSESWDFPDLTLPTEGEQP